MLTITESAKNHLARLLREEGDVLRLAPTENGLVLYHDQPRPGDEVHKHDGSPLLVLEESVSSSIGRHTLDVAVERGTTTLTLRQPASGPFRRSALDSTDQASTSHEQNVSP